MVSLTPVRLLALVALCVAAGCTYEPTFDVICDDEGAVEDGRRCEGGVWVATTDAGTGQPDTDGGGECAESADELCERLGLTCDEVTAEDRCGEMRTVDCGTCTGQAECGGGGTPNVCACPGQSDEAFCRSYGKNCGTLTARDGCGQMRTAPCGECGDLGTCTDNVCDCDDQFACGELGYECGDVNVDGRCGDVASISCGTCPEFASCEQNACSCDEGFDPVRDGCQDVDECANAALNDCDENATCTNTPGSFECECIDGYVGDGTECEIPPLVDSVQEVVVTIPNGSQTQTAPIPVAVAEAQTVLFATQRNNGVREADEMTVRVSLSAADEVEVFRPDSDGDTTVVVYVVEFNPAKATVQGSEINFGGTSLTDPLPTSVDPAKAFLVFNHAVADNTTDKDDILVSGRLDATGDNVQFDRQANKGTVLGTYWVVEAVDDAFSVQHVEDAIPDGNGGAALGIDAVTPAKAFLLYSYGTDLNNDDADRTHVRCELQDATNVFCRRQRNNDDITDLAVQVVSFAGDEFVQRGTEEIISDRDGATRTLDTAVDPARSIAFGGQLGVLGLTQLGTDQTEEVSAGFFTQQLIDAGQSIDLARGTPRNARAFVSWQVLQW